MSTPSAPSAVLGPGDLHVAVMQRNGEDYQLVGELLGECSACNLHLAMSLMSKLKEYGLVSPPDALVLQPSALLKRRQRQRLRSHLAFGGWPSKAWPRAEERAAPPAESSQGGCSWNELPPDLLLRAAERLGQEDRLVAACACGAWRAAIGSRTREACFTWAGRAELQEDSEEPPLIDRVLRGAAVIYTDLRKASLRRCELLSSDALAAFARASLRNVQELDLAGCKALTDVGIIAVAEACPRLRSLQLASCQALSDCAFVALGSFCPELTAVSACGCEQLTDLGLSCLSQGARGLRQINLGWCEALTEAGIQALASNCPGLQSVDLCGCLQVGDDGIAALAARCPGLRSLGLHCCRRLTDASQAALAARLTGLASLNVSGCRALSPAAVQAVVDANPGLHTCSVASRTLIVAGCLPLLAVSCACPTSPVLRW